MSVYEREPFADFLQQIIQIRLATGVAHPVHDALLKGRANDEETVVALSVAPDDAARARKSLRTIHQDFPYGSTVPQQSAYLMRAFIGLDPFGDSDNATAWSYLRALLGRHGWTLDADDSATADFVTNLHAQLHATRPGGFHRGHVLDRDELFSELVEWFETRLVPDSTGADQHL